MAAAKPTKTKKILIVEDEGDICLLLNIMLSNETTVMDHVKTIAEAKSYLGENQPDVMVLDNKLPDGWGIEFLDYIKTNYPDIKILMISGMENPAIELGLSKGADQFLAKPFTKKQMQDSLDGLLN